MCNAASCSFLRMLKRKKKDIISISHEKRISIPQQSFVCYLSFHFVSEQSSWDFKSMHIFRHVKSSMSDLQPSSLHQVRLDRSNSMVRSNLIMGVQLILFNRRNFNEINSLKEVRRMKWLTSLSHA